MREPVVPYVKLCLETVPPLEQNLLRNRQGPRVNGTIVQLQVISGTDIVDDLGKNPYEPITDDVLLHGLVALRIPSRSGISEPHKAHVIDLKTCLSPQH